MARSANVTDINAPWSGLKQGSVLGGATTRAFLARTSKGVGKNFAVRVEADPCLISLDSREVNKAFGAQLQEILAAEIRAITENVGRSTTERRLRHFREWNKFSQYRSERKSKPRTKRKRTGTPRKGTTGSRGSKGRAPSRSKQPHSTVRKRFSGGRIGDTPPQDPGSAPRWNKKFNQSGRITRTTITPHKASSTKARAFINFPANRFDPRTTDRVDGIIMDAQRLIPMLGGRIGPKTAAQWQQMLEAQKEAVAASTWAEYRRKRRALRDIQMGILRTIAKAATGGAF